MMKQVQPDVWETEVYSPFPGLNTHAYLLTRESGNILFYSTGLADEVEGLAGVGGVAWQLLSHRDEIGDTLNQIAKRYGSGLGGHRAEQTEFARVREPDILFRHRETLFGNIEVIPTPGHSPGSTCFLVSSPHGKRYLFTGDTIVLDDHGEWEAGFIPGHNTENDKRTLADSLHLLKTMAPDVVFCSGTATGVGFEELTPEGWVARVDRALEQL